MSAGTRDLPRLDHALVRSGALAARPDLDVPALSLLELPEKAVQFGTGALLRGLVDDVLDEANRRGVFGGRVVAVGSTGSGREARLDDQDGLYTLVVQGVEQGVARRELRVISSVSRAISAADDWDAVLACARNPSLELVFSNTTEVGIALEEGDAPELAPPRSFPGKLTRFLLERARAFDFARDKGVVVLPCELIEDNGDTLRSIVLALAARWGLGAEFPRWVEDAVPFCNTLVDRIVPGAPPPDDARALSSALGYRDEMLTSCEVYRLLAIEGDEALRARLPFADADRGVLVAPDIAPYRERKVRLLNGAHTVMVPTALLCGCETVREAVEHEAVRAFVRHAVLGEIVPTVTAPGAEAFAHEVLERFANPYIRHALFDITLQGTTKMRVRVVPTILRYAERFGRAPASLTFGFAANVLFMRGDLQRERARAGLPVPADARAERLRDFWAEVRRGEIAAHVRALAADAELWGADLTGVPGFADAVGEHLARMVRDGVAAALAAHLANGADAPGARSADTPPADVAVPASTSIRS